MTTAPRVLSVQSHVVHGYVGNRSAVFPLQLLGFEVDVINSVQFSCHTGYPVLAGQRVSGDDLRTLIQGLAQNECLDHSFLLTGYIGAASFLQEILTLRQMLPKDCCYVCDPVMGDNGHLYVPEELVAVYRSDVLQHVSILTPNQFEVELLTERKITNIQEAVDACNFLHSKGPRVVVLTTLDVPEATRDGKCVAMLLSYQSGRKWLLRVPWIEGGPFTGTGDLTAAMILAYTHMVPHELPLALEKAAAVLQGVLRNTVSSRSARMIAGKRVSPELRLVESKSVIESPVVSHHCQLVEPLGIAGVLFDQETLEDGSKKMLETLKASGLKVGCLVSKGSAPRFPDIETRSDSAEVIQQWGVEASAVLVVGASVKVLRGARGSGSLTVAFLKPRGACNGGYRGDVPTDTDALAEEADFVISCLDSLRRLLPLGSNGSS
eukprot:Skav216126  [mRNA]  locus=scaffold1946:273925:276132:+ [translate_table: standard]